jgi:tetratricopeptide (TPR) repeat protein
MTKIVLAKKLTNFFFNICLVFIMGGCTPPEGDDFKKGMAEASSKNFTNSLVFFARATKRSPESSWALKSAREAARISYFELKEHKKAVEFYQHLVMYSDDTKERFEAQRKLGDIYLENLQDYPKAIMEYSRLAEQELSDQEVGQNRLGLARAYYYQNNLFQAESELNEALKLKIEPPLRFSSQMLKGNIFIARKEFSKAANLFNELIKNYPEKAQQENVPMTLAVCYEEAADFQNALTVLEGMRGKYNPPEYIELRIKRLKERQKNQPGAKGYRK